MTVDSTTFNSHQFYVQNLLNALRPWITPQTVCGTFLYYSVLVKMTHQYYKQTGWLDSQIDVARGFFLRLAWCPWGLICAS